MSKILVLRIKPILSKIIHTDQSAFIPGRYIGEPIRLISDIISYTTHNNISGIIFGADYEAAFDSVDHKFLFASLKKFGFKESFITWIQLLHTNIESCIMNNGHSTRYFKINRGTRQGDPMAAYLFILIMEILACQVRNNQNIKGINIASNSNIKIALFADDTTFFLKDVSSCKALTSTLENFSRITSMNINFNKSEAAWIGTESNNESKPIGCNWVNLNISSLKILGIHFSYSKSELNRLNFRSAEEKFDVLLNRWSKRNLTVYGRIEIVKTLAISKLLYVSSLCIPPVDFIQRIQAKINIFVWKNKRPKVKFTTSIGPYEKGGLKMPDFESYIKRHKIMWIQRLLNNQCEQKAWTFIPKFYLSKTGGLHSLYSNINALNITKLMPCFWKSSIETWAEFVHQEPATVTEVLSQPVLNNVLIKFKLHPGLIKRLLNMKIYLISDLITDDGNFKSWEIITQNSVELKKFQLHYLGLISAIPKRWKCLIKNNYEEISNSQQVQTKIMCKLGTVDLRFITSKSVYLSLISEKFVQPTALKQWEQTTQIDTDNWDLYFSSIFYTTLEKYSREFQFKVIHRYLPVNTLTARHLIKTIFRTPVFLLISPYIQHIYNITGYLRSSVIIYQKKQQVFSFILVPFTSYFRLYDCT